MSGPTINRAESSGNIWTPQIFRQAVVHKFGMPYADLACGSNNMFASYCGYTIKDDSLVQPWHDLKGLLWLNPPFSEIRLWADKCAREWKLGAEILLLVPMGSQNWYWDFVEPYAQVYCVGRMVFDNCFDKQGRLVTTAYPKDLILAHYQPGKHSNRPQRWRWQDD